VKRQRHEQDAANGDGGRAPPQRRIVPHGAEHFRSEDEGSPSEKTGETDRRRDLQVHRERQTQYGRRRPGRRPDTGPAQSSY